MSLPDTTVNKNLEGRSARAGIQRFGSFLAGMIMPNIGAFIAWGLLTAIFLDVGWWPNATIAKLISPMITYLLPLLIGYTGGKMVNGTRGGVIGAIATIGVAVGASIPMFLGAMVMGPFAAWILKLLDRLYGDRIKAGFEMLVDNFTIGIAGMVLAIAGHLGVEPLVTTLMGWMASGVNVLITHHLLPLASIFVEPAKVLFLNNAVNHGILTPLGTEQARTAGRSILFMVESNPGPGFGLLLAYLVFGSRKIRESVPGAIIIHLFGGIHEIFFPYVLMKPKTILATMAGGMSGLAVGVWLNAGLVAPASPGSILAWFAMCPRNAYLPMILDFLVATTVSFVVAALLIRPDRARDDAADEAAAATVPVAESGFDAASVSKVIIACDAGMGSSAMVASTMKKRLAPLGIQVVHSSVDNLPGDAQLVLTQDGLVDRVRGKATGARVIPFTNYTGDPAFDRVEAMLRQAHGAPAPTTAVTVTAPDKVQAVLDHSSVRLGLHASSKEEAIRMAGQVLVDAGAASPEYIEGMLAREGEISTYMGEGFTIPHGTNASRVHIHGAALGFLQFPDGVDWNGQTCYVAIPIASKTDEHLDIIASLARVLTDKDQAERLRTASTADEVLAILAPGKD
ncbi:PTS mannitol transporter subunit IICBA [Acidipropionibacterium timonense]|uniref:PTS mannitol transporter subunit IICBA n=1 Tax=Acidipropionibacterium timonense TaxID=2161818 RepID=UPI00102FCC6C|nr:PTS mannitol transporter subunit IICBA [Acidipropionibacterium timonense]